jgi:hypothetical protein
MANQNVAHELGPLTGLVERRREKMSRKGREYIEVRNLVPR